MSKYSDWQKGIANRNYHVLHNLVKRDEVNKVIAVDFIPFNWKRAVKTYIYDQILNDTRGDIVYGDLTSRCWQISSKILVYSTIDSLLNPEKIISELNKIIDKEEMRDNLIVWNYDPFYTDYFNKYNQVLNIFDAVDDWSTHSSYNKYAGTLRRNYETIKLKSDLIFTVSEYLKKKIFDNQTNCFWLANAVDLQNFQNETKIHPLLKNIKKPIIGFLGILQDRIDTEILTYLVEKNPDKSLVLAGPVWQNFTKKKLRKYSNIHFLGLIKHPDIPSLYNGFDCGIIPYKTNDFIKSIDPMKIYEYLAAGLPIVSTPISGLERFSNLIGFADSPENFNNAVNYSLNLDKNEIKRQAWPILEQNTWDIRIGEMLELINQKLTP